MMDFQIKLTKRTRRRKTLAGVVHQDRHIANYRDPFTGARVQRFFERKREAELKAQGLWDEAAEEKP